MDRKVALFLLIFVVVGLALSSCSDNTANNVEQQEFSVDLTIYVVDKKTMYEYAEYYDVDTYNGGLKGFSVFSDNPEVTGCKVYVLTPDTVDSVITWGHEIMHCAYRSFHEEGYEGVTLP